MGNLTHDLPKAETFDDMVVLPVRPLPVGIHDCRSDEAKATVFEVLAECLGFGGSRWNLPHVFQRLSLVCPPTKRQQ
jgi:hypothetical protein